MKKIFSLLLLAGVALLVSNCTDFADLEDVEPKNSVPAGTAINNFSSATAAVNGIYDEMQGPAEDLYFDGWLAMAQYFSDECIFTGTFPTRQEFGQLNVFPANSTMASAFSQMYDVINVANAVIDQIPGVEDPTLDDAQKNAFLGEARFIRALTYWHLTEYWGDVPLVLTPTSDVGEVLNVPNNTQAEVYAQIVADLEFAEANVTNTNTSKATVQAATGLLARVYLYQENWSGAYDKAVEALGDGFDLTQFAYLEDQIFALAWTNIDGNALNFYYGPSETGGRHSIEPSQTLIDAYEDGDMRKSMSIVEAGEPFLFGGQSITATVPFGQKYPSFDAGIAGTAADPIFFIRHAELCLIAAEAAAEQGDFMNANAYYNMVRNRAGLGDQTLDAGNFVDLILQERFVELAMEGPHRLLDLRRKGQAEQVLGPTGYNPCDNVWPLPQRDLDRNPNLVQNTCCNC